MQEEYESYFESHFELLGPSVIEAEKEEDQEMEGISLYI